MSRLCVISAAVLVLISMSTSSHAAIQFRDEDPASATATLKGNLVKTPDCHINNDNIINVSFGNVGVNKVDGIQYSRSIDYTVHCDSNSDKHLYLSVKGTKVDWDDSAVTTSVDNLAIEIRQNGKPLTLGSDLSIDLNAPPSLTAVPVKNSGQTLTAENFEAGATLVAFYQ
jgi:hypothetical protein